MSEPIDPTDLLRAVASHLDAALDEALLDQPLSELGLDSLDLVEIVAALEAGLGVLIDFARSDQAWTTNDYGSWTAASLPTLRDLAVRLSARAAAPPDPATAPPDPPDPPDPRA